MLIVLFSWAIMGVSALLAGYLLINFLYPSGRENLKTVDVYMVSGLLFITVYAQFFSLFYKVGALACTILFCLEIIVFAVYVVLHRDKVVSTCKSIHVSFFPVILFIVLMLITLRYAVQTTWHYDTGLYHAQAIQWIEKYGVVPGLGNLHERFAYNSSFMCLQALYSLKWFFERGDSLHTLNGFLSLIGLSYGLISMDIWKTKKWSGADTLRCVLIWCVVYNRWELSSCGTDMWALMLVIYICVKWCECLEDGEKALDLRCYLCVVSVYAVTVKLSTITSLLLVIWPVIYLLKNRDWGRIWKYTAAGVLTIAPFLIRNVLISGYLIYPVSALDLFSVDWKMDKQILEQDKAMIILYGRQGSHEMEALNLPVWEWLPTWFTAMSVAEKILIIMGACAFLAGLISMVIQIRRKKNARALLLLTCMAGLIYWILTAPLMRYGFAYLLLMLAVVTYDVKGQMGRKLCRCIWIASVVAALFLYARDGLSMGIEKKWIWPDGYANFAGEEADCDGVTFYLPVEDDRIGYYYFPSTPYKGRLNHMELRGEDISEGFRPRADAQ